MKTIKYVLYARKSTEGDTKQAQSIQAQLRVMNEVAERYGLNVVETIHDEKSAKLPGKRPGFDRMIKLIENGTVNGILVYEHSRLSRNPYEQGLIAQLLQDEKILSIRTHDKDYRPDDNAVVMGVEASIANQFIRDLRRNVKRGIRQKAMNGGISGQPPVGYLNLYGKKKIIIDPVRFPLVRKAFDMVLAGHTPQEARKVLTEWGLTMPRSGKPISYPSIYQMLANPRYAGKVPDPDDPSVMYEAAFEPMITVDEYDRVQQILGQKGKPRLCETKYFAFRGLFRCGECGGGVSPQTKNKKLKNGTVRSYTYYRCNMKRKCSQKKSTREEDLFEQADELLSKYAISPELYDWGLKALEEISSKELAERENVHTAHLLTAKAIQKQLDGLLDKFTLDQIDAADYHRKKNELDERLASLRKEEKPSLGQLMNWYELVGNKLEKIFHTQSNNSNNDPNHKRMALESIGLNFRLKEGNINIVPYPWLTRMLNVDIKNVKRNKAKQDIVITYPKNIFATD